MAKSDVAAKVEELAVEHGYCSIGYTTTDNLRVTEDVRDMCAANTCHSYNTNWSCPPQCGTIDYFRELIAGYNECVVFQTVEELEDEFDFETMMEASESHSDRMLPFSNDVRKIAPGCLFLAAGACTICDECTFPDNPCRFPEKKFVAMEAAGLVVSNVCVAAGVPYNHGSDHIAYVSCVLL